MAQESSEKRSASAIEHASKRKWGYDDAQVDAFLEHAHNLYEGEGNQLKQSDIQNVSFDLKKGGYIIKQVDATLSRLERAVIDKQTQWEVNQLGLTVWRAQNEELFSAIARRAERDHGSRFADGKRGQPSYDRKQVDTMIDKVVRKCAVELGDQGSHLEGLGEFERDDVAYMSATTVSNVIFTQRKGARGYDERQVDNFLSVCVHLLSRLESYARLADYAPANGDEEASAAKSADNPHAITSPFSGAQATPLAADQYSGVDLAQSPAPALTVGSAESTKAAQPESFADSQPPDAAKAVDQESYDALQRAEQQVFGGADANRSIVIPPSLQQAPYVAPASAHTALDSESAPNLGGDSSHSPNRQDSSDLAVPSLAALAQSTEHSYHVKTADATPESSEPLESPASAGSATSPRDFDKPVATEIVNPLQAPRISRSVTPKPTATSEPASGVSQASAPVAFEPADIPVSFPPASQTPHSVAATREASTEAKSSGSSPQPLPAYDNLTYPSQHTETERPLDELPDLSFPVFRPRHQQDATASGSHVGNGANVDGTKGEDGSEPNKHTGSGGE